MNDIDVIQEGIPSDDGCPTLRRIKAFLSPQGVITTLEHVFRDRKGNPIDLRQGRSFVNVSEGSAASLSESYPDPEAGILVRIKEATLNLDTYNQPFRVEGWIEDAENGVVRCKIPRECAGQSGLYRMSWGFSLDCDLKYAENALLSVEHTLFGFDTTNHLLTAGSPTINDVRMQMWDTDPEFKRLDDVEYGDEQIATALIRPIEYFNSTNPPISQMFDTRNFPWKQEWISATIGYLYEYAAMYYQRQRLSVNSGGKTLDEFDQGRIKDYLQTHQMKIADWKEFVLKKKCELNAANCVGSVISPYY